MTDKPRIWLARFDPAADFVWRKKTKFNGDICRPGEPVDKSMFDERTLRRFYEQRRVTLVDDPRAPEPANEPDSPEAPGTTAPELEAPNASAFFMSTGDKDALSMDLGDRRFAVMEPANPAEEVTLETVATLEEQAARELVDLTDLAVTADPEHVAGVRSPAYTLEINGAWGQILKDGEPHGPKMRKKAAEAKLGELTNGPATD